MAVEIKNINNKSAWELFDNKDVSRTFLQSWEWGEFQKKMNNKIWRLGIFDNNNLLDIALVSKVVAKRGIFLLIQHGPAELKVKSQKSKMLGCLLEKLKEIGKEERVSFIRISPLWEKTEENKAIFKNLGFKQAPMHANAYEATWKLDIVLPEDDLLKNMRKTTRYLIKQAIKNKDISIEKSEKLVDIEKYQKLNKLVSKKQYFTPFSQDYIKNEFEVFSKEGNALCFFGEYKGELVATALIIFWSGIAFYHQAASGFKYSKLSIPYLIAWEAIKEAKKRNCVLFDFWGFTDPKLEPKHPWAGPTLFKMGFGGKSFEYIKTQDFPLSKKYWINYLIESFRKIKRKY
ncbi:peptidoglycan bridge formation glycyltransferase FemA/FemB family protein [Patescibacteria group bacterium]|nr:peptidoglycan bridge formation glycyltransferase FemA/FemB family protein [Patescibacteria group bacterium]MBU0879729.1 peptidoglycan bridge formation glycyltransferase FemA/FemB family protein [Patescibacteria group bacterium]MBU0880420.1 peptidoglycan bridge formation glycyltransferase FemA/FemB family protein [Patescibacteria group bacterium]MBU1782972.1 peptidoglycan bridge formation glycyltransferase FemA/FemB family protein [Patescibacteria group bacterium]MBU2081132.1 peptidoglycan br